MRFWKTNLEKYVLENEILEKCVFWNCFFFVHAFLEKRNWTNAFLEKNNIRKMRFLKFVLLNVFVIK